MRTFLHRAALAGTFLAWIAWNPSASAAVLTVQNNLDAGPGSLRQALLDNQASGGGNTIVFADAVRGTIPVTSGELVVARDATIVGPGAAQLSLVGNGAQRVLRIGSVNVTISGLTLRGGSVSAAQGRGAGILNEGTLRLTRCVVTGNRARQDNVLLELGGTGGGIANVGRLTLEACLVSGNQADNAGGGVWNARDAAGRGGELTLRNCTLSDNVSAGLGSGGRGGGLFNASNATCSATSSTLSGNRANDGGAIENRGTLALTNCTLSANSALVTGGLFAPTATRLRNTLIAGNVSDTLPERSDVTGIFISFGFNLVGINPSNEGLSPLASDRTGTAAAPRLPLLGPLQDNGGDTPTMLPLPGSPAIDQGNAAPSLDQRGRFRPYDQAGVLNVASGNGADVGAVEVQPEDEIVFLVQHTRDDGPGSLRQHLADLPAGGVIRFASGVTGTVTLASGDLVLAKNLSLYGPGAKRLTLSGGGVNRIFNCSRGTVLLADVTLADGFAASGSGGGISQSGGNLTLSNCVVRRNVAQATGGGWAVRGGSASAIGCTFTENSAVSWAGAIDVQGGVAGLYNCTLSGNRVTAPTGLHFGGAIRTTAALALTNCTVVSNVVQSGRGGGISGNATLMNTLIARNSAGTSPDVQGAISSDGHNLLGQVDGSTGLTNGVRGDLAGTSASPLDPRVSPLTDNGGTTPTHALLTESPAVDRGRIAGPDFLTDQRGIARPYDFRAVPNGPDSDASDIGALELSPPALALRVVGTQLQFAWPVWATGYRLESSPAIPAAPPAWSAVSGSPTRVGDEWVVMLSVPAANRFYRLVTP